MSEEIKNNTGDAAAEPDKKEEAMPVEDVAATECDGKPEKKKKEKKSKEKEELEKLQKEFESYKQNHLRILAEYDNYRKRTANEKTQIYGNAVSDTLSSILPVADNIDRALAQENAGAEDFRKGVEMIASQFSSSFEKLGVTIVGQIGETFNPEIHNAVSHIDSEELGDNVIAAVFQKGYKLGDKVIRHAMVQVAN